jgi:hypothetical protein
MPEELTGDVALQAALELMDAKPGQTVDGIIVAHDIDPKLQYAAAAVPGATVMAYEIAFRLVDASLAPTAAPTASPPRWPPPDVKA